MARAWTKAETTLHAAQIKDLYTEKNLSISEIAKLQSIAYQTVFKRLKKCGVVTTPQLKVGYRNTRRDVVIPKKRTEKLAEFFGLMLGDGHVSHNQVIVTLGSKESSYAEHVRKLMKDLFGGEPKIAVRKGGYRDVYLGSTFVTSWLTREGLLGNKVLSQVGVPSWIESNNRFAQAFLRGFFDTDGSVYRLKYGIQISFSNKSKPLQHALHMILTRLGYTPSAISGSNIYVTNRHQIRRFFQEIAPANKKHVLRFRSIMKSVGTQAVKGDAL